jgi:hypothetical protein
MAFSPRPGILQSCDNHHKVDEKGVEGMLPLGCLPLWGREGISLVAVIRGLAERRKKRFSPEPFF